MLTPVEEGSPKLTREINEEHACEALKAYAASVGYDFEHSAGIVRDLLSSLLHYWVAHRLGDWQTVIYEANSDFKSESHMIPKKARSKSTKKED